MLLQYSNLLPQISREEAHLSQQNQHPKPPKPKYLFLQFWGFGAFFYQAAIPTVRNVVQQMVGCVYRLSQKDAEIPRGFEDSNHLKSSVIEAGVFWKQRKTLPTKQRSKTLP